MGRLGQDLCWEKGEAKGFDEGAVGEWFFHFFVPLHPSERQDTSLPARSLVCLELAVRRLTDAFRLPLGALVLWGRFTFLSSWVELAGAHLFTRVKLFDED